MYQMNNCKITLIGLFFAIFLYVVSIAFELDLFA